MQAGRAVVFRFGGKPGASVEERERCRVVRAECVNTPPARTLFVRPDGFVAWAGERDGDGLYAALAKWLGVAFEHGNERTPKGLLN